MLSDIQKKIMRMLIEKGEIDNKELQKDLNLPISTFYTQLEALKGICVTRKRGKLELSSQPSTDLFSSFYEKLKINRQKKEELANFIVLEGFIKRGDITLLDCGTTNYIIAEKIIESQKRGLDIITVNPYILKELLNYPEVGKVSIVGGMLNWSDGSVYGPLSTDALRKLGEIGTIILGIDAIDQNGEMGINDPLEIEQKQVMIEKAKTLLIPITDDKLDRAVSYNIANCHQIRKDFKIIIAGKLDEISESALKVITSIGKDHFIFTGG